MASGRIPLWNPHENGGEPLAGNPTASLFYPGKLLFVLLPYATAYKIYLVGHVWLAALAMYLAARRHGLEASAASLASLTYAGSGFLLFQVYNIVFLVGAAWLPFGMYLVHRVIESPTLRLAVGLAWVLAMQILGGDPQVAQMTLVLAIPALLFRHLPFFRALLLFLGVAGLGLGITYFSGRIKETLDQIRTSPTWTDGLSLLWLPGEVFSTAIIARLIWTIMELSSC